MTRTPSRKLLAEIEAFESAAFRAAAGARGLLSLGLPEPAGVFPALRHEGPSVQIVTQTIEDATLWTDHFGITLTVTADETSNAELLYVTSMGEGQANGLRLTIGCNNVWTAEQLQTWRSRRVASDEGGDA